MPSQKEVSIVIKKIKKKVRNFELPLTTKVGYETKNSFKILIATILSPQTKDTVTYPAFKRLMKLANTPKKILELDEKEIAKTIYPVSFYKIKAKRIKEVCRILLKEYKGKVPSSLEKLIKLPGVGRKVAGLVLIYGFGKAENIPVDTHVHKVSNRLGWVKTKAPEQTEKELMKIIPKKYWPEINDLFVKLGQNICLANPKCEECPVKEYCRYYKSVFKRKI